MCAIPGVYFVILNPILLFGLKQNTTNFGSSVLVSASMILFFLIPFIIQTVVNEYDNYKLKLSYLFDKKIFIISIIVTLLCSLNFIYNGNIGGGIILKLSYFYLIIHI